MEGAGNWERSEFDSQLCNVLKKKTKPRLRICLSEASEKSLHLSDLFLRWYL